MSAESKPLAPNRKEKKGSVQKWNILIINCPYVNRFQR